MTFHRMSHYENLFIIFLIPIILYLTHLFTIIMHIFENWVKKLEFKHVVHNDDNIN